MERVLEGQDSILKEEKVKTALLADMVQVIKSMVTSGADEGKKKKRKKPKKRSMVSSSSSE